MQTTSGQGSDFIASTENQWVAVLLVAIGAFTIVTSEFLPVGMLTQLSAAFNASEGRLGLSVTLPGLLAAITAPILVFAVGTLDRKYVVVFLSFLTTISCVTAGTANSLGLFLLGRTILGVAIGGFWSFAIVLARRLVTVNSGHRAAAIVGAGISLGTILGLPFGSFASVAIGWRGSFYAVALLSAIVGFAQLYYLPALKTESANAVADVGAIFKIEKARYGLILMGLSVIGHFAGYTYLDPYLRSLNGISESQVTVGLLLFGASGFFGTFATEVSTKRIGSWGTFLAASAILAIILALASLVKFTVPIGFLIVASWGFIWGLMPTLFSIWLFEAAPQFVESASGIFVLTVQTAVAVGSFAGGRIFDLAGLPSTFGFASLAYASTGILLVAYNFRPIAIEPSLK